MNRRFRLTSSTEFKRVRRKGKSYAHPLVILYALSTGEPASRFGVTTAHGLGGAVLRNRAKRRLRGALQDHLETVAPGYNIVLVARPALLDAETSEVERAVIKLLERASLLEREGEPQDG